MRRLTIVAWTMGVPLLAVAAGALRWWDRCNEVTTPYAAELCASEWGPAEFWTTIRLVAVVWAVGAVVLGAVLPRRFGPPGAIDWPEMGAAIWMVSGIALLVARQFPFGLWLLVWAAGASGYAIALAARHADFIGRHDHWIGLGWSVGMPIAGWLLVRWYALVCDDPSSCVDALSLGMVFYGAVVYIGGFIVLAVVLGVAAARRRRSAGYRSGTLPPTAAP
jgi:hypothetical protein